MRSLRARIAVLLPSIAVFFVFAAIPLIAGAQTTADLGLAQAQGVAVLEGDIRTIVANIIRAFFGLVGLVLVGFFLYGGFRWLTSGGDSSQVEDAKKILINATIGAIIMLSAYAIAEFVIRSILAGAMGGVNAPRVTAPATFGNYGAGSRYFGSGIIEYHYPEVGQTDVPRNTKVAITFKSPLVLPSVLEGYDDNGTFTIADDTVNGQPAVAGSAFALNEQNIKIIPNAELGAPGSGSGDALFDARYPDAGTVAPTPIASVTVVDDAFDPAEGQTLVIMFQSPIGSPSTDVNYRVALRGGDNGIRVWTEDVATGEPEQVNAFDTNPPDGAYFWPFTTGTLLDTTPPQIKTTVPAARPDPSTRRLARNQLLQVHFDEAVDPTVASGITGPAAQGGQGFTTLNVLARCISGLSCDAAYQADFVPIVGEWKLSNRYRTAEFMPAAPCEGVTTNSCGERVYCLPKNVELRVIAAASLLGAQAPAGIIPPNGIVDMVNNSMDGNRNGIAEGPYGEDRPAWFSLNIPQTDLAAISDSVLWVAQVGDSIDLVPPEVTDIVPKSYGPPPELTDAFDAPDGGGPSRVPADLPVTSRWSKTLSVGSLRTGAFDDVRGDFADQYGTVALRVNECQKDADADCAPGAPCDCTPVPPPYFFTNVDIVDDATAGAGEPEQVSVLEIRHRPFLTGNDLGYTAQEITDHPERAPSYVPVLRATVKDTTQNCFYPSRGYDCDATSNAASCCNRDAQGSFTCSP